MTSAVTSLHSLCSFQTITISPLVNCNIFLSCFPAPDLLVPTALTSKASFTSSFFPTELWSNCSPSESTSINFRHWRINSTLLSIIFLPCLLLQPLFHSKVGTGCACLCSLEHSYFLNSMEFHPFILSRKTRIYRKFSQEHLTGQWEKAWSHY